jgi:2-polyprenyl-3-methyl-5-hydroxy-6-metoxy-1,4-benzoquinol methylase
MLKLSKNRYYGSALANSNLWATNAYGWGFQFKKNSPQNLTISYLGVFHIGARIRARILEKILSRENLSKKTLLDAGCGMGLTSIFLSSKFKTVTGVDLDVDKIKQAKILAKENKIKNIDFKKADLLKNNFTQKKFDFAICFEVIEHVKNADFLLDTLSKRVVKGGKVILSFPSDSFLSAIAQKSLQHERVGFLPADIKKIIKNKNLIIEEEYSFGNTWAAQGIVGSDFFIRKTFPILSAVLFPIVYPFMIFDLSLPKMGVPRGYILVLRKK